MRGKRRENIAEESFPTCTFRPATAKKDQYAPYYEFVLKTHDPYRVFKLTRKGTPEKIINQRLILRRDVVALFLAVGKFRGHR